nr:MAG TPA: hypothetical protein [Caudoviricetes sp.]
MIHAPYVMDAELMIRRIMNVLCNVVVPKEIYVIQINTMTKR